MISSTTESIIAAAYGDAMGKTASLNKTADLVEARKVAGALTKCASAPYNPAEYDAVCEIMKIASSTMSGLAEAVEAESARAQQLNKIAEVRAVIDDMIDNGMISKDEVMEKSAALFKKTDRELEIVKEAMKLTKTSSMSSLFDSASESASSTKTEKGMFASALN